MGRVTMTQLGRKQSYCKTRWRTNGSTTNISEWWLRNVEGTAPSTSKYRRIENPKFQKLERENTQGNRWSIRGGPKPYGITLLFINSVNDSLASGSLGHYFSFFPSHCLIYP